MKYNVGNFVSLKLTFFMSGFVDMVAATPVKEYYFYLSDNANRSLFNVLRFVQVSNVHLKIVENYCYLKGFWLQIVTSGKAILST